MPSMKHIAVAASALTAASPALALPRPSGSGNPGSVAKALYFLQNDPAGSSLVALDASNGQVANPVRIETGGIGAAQVNGAGQQAVMVDTLGSQGAVAVDGDYIFTVNAGSNTLSMFQIDPQDPTHPRLVGNPTDTMGDFPVSVAYSDMLKTVCVANGGAKNNIACWKNDADYGLCPMGDARPLGLDLATPPVMTSTTVSQISFTPNGQELVVTSKGAMGSNIPGQIFVIPVVDGVVSQQLVKSSVADIPSPFGFAYGPSSDSFLLSDPTFGGSVIDVDQSSFQTSELTHQKSSLAAPCWASYSPTTGAGYLSDAGMPQMGEVDIMTGELKDVFPIGEELQGLFDTHIDGAIAYFIAKTANVVAFDVQEKRLVQSLDLTNVAGVGARQWWQGMAMWASS